MDNNNKDIALSLIETKEFLTDAEKDIVFSYSPDLVWKFLNKIDEKYDIPFFLDI